MSKAKSFAALKAEIAELEVQADAARRLEVKEAVSSIKELIAKYGLTAAELGFKGPGMGATKSKAIQSRPGTGVPKYRDPKSGKTWTGAGKPPGWIASARNREVFLIDAQVPAAPSTEAAKPATTKSSPATAKSASVAKAKPGTAAAVKPAAKPATKPATKPTAKAGSSPKKAAPKAAAKATKPSTAKAGAGRTKIAVRKMEGSKKPRPAQRKKTAGGGAAPMGEVGGGAPVASPAS
jgi:DNA-binding protein H-NS